MKYILGLSDSETIVNFLKFIIFSNNLDKLNLVFSFNNISNNFLKKLNEIFNSNNILNFFYIFKEEKIIEDILKQKDTFNDINEYILNELKFLKEISNFVYISSSVDPINSDIVANNIKLLIKDTIVFNTQNYNDFINKAFLINFLDKNFYYQVISYPLKVFDFLYVLVDKTNLLNKVNSIVFNIFDIDLFRKNYNSNEFILIESNKIYDIFKNNFIAISKDLKEKTYIDYLWSLMIKLRYNCLWDKKQTSLSIKDHLIEEAYEVFDAISSPEKLKEELGDLLLQIVFHSQINYDEKNFSFIDVVESLINKLIYRHPHIFQNLEVNDISNLLINWENFKKNNKDSFINLPKALPSLIKLLLIFRKFKRINKLDFLLHLINSEIENFANDYSNKKNSNNYLKDIKIFLKLITNFTKENINLEEILNKFINKLIKKINNEYKSKI